MYSSRADRSSQTSDLSGLAEDCYLTHNIGVSEAVAAIRAWTRLDAAITAFNRYLDREFGVTGAQLAVLRLVQEWAGGGAVALTAMRERLVMHPATLGQLLDRLARRGLVAVEPDPGDRRRRLVALTDAGVRLAATAPVAGPVRLRYTPADPARLRRLADALDDAIMLFGLEEFGLEEFRNGGVPR
jgi:DNA-binding MarR family transcriptional regulator